MSKQLRQDVQEGKSLSDLLKDQALQPRHAAKLMEAMTKLAEEKERILKEAGLL